MSEGNSRDIISRIKKVLILKVGENIITVGILMYIYSYVMYPSFYKKVRFNPVFYFVFSSNLNNNLMLLFQAPTSRRIIAL